MEPTVLSAPIVDIADFNMKLNGRWFPKIVDRDSRNVYQIYIY